MPSTATVLRMLPLKSVGRETGHYGLFRTLTLEERRTRGTQCRRESSHFARHQMCQATFLELVIEKYAQSFDGTFYLIKSWLPQSDIHVGLNHGGRRRVWKDITPERANSLYQEPSAQYRLESDDGHEHKSDQQLEHNWQSHDQGQNHRWKSWKC